jgi:hypothetical protein
MTRVEQSYSELDPEWAETSDSLVQRGVHQASLYPPMRCGLQHLYASVRVNETVMTEHERLLAAIFETDPSPTVGVAIGLCTLSPDQTLIRQL